MATKKIAIYGAYGHTARFIIARLLQRGWQPILCGRDVSKLNALAKEYPTLETRTAHIDNSASLDKAFEDALLVVNCAGPFLDSAFPIIESALRLSIHYIDISAEQKSVLDVFETYADKASKENIIIMPAMAFYGGLPDLLSTVAVKNWEHVDDITIGIALSSWQPTLGTRLTGQRNHYPRMIYANGQLEPKQESYPEKYWNFPKPLGSMKMVALPFSEIITISRHINTDNVFTYLSLNSLEDVRNNELPPPSVVDERGRSSQQFCVEVIATKGDQKRIASATGMDIYAVTSPLVVEAIERIASGNYLTTGVKTAGQIFDAEDFIKSLSPDDVLFSLPQSS